MKVISQILPKIGSHGNVLEESEKEVRVEQIHARLWKSVQ